MRILVAGALSWNPERFRSLCERGHELWGLWSRSMPWDQGPYPALETCVRPVALADAARTIREQGIDCVYSLFQVYHPRLWARPSPGIEHGAWTLLRELCRERARGAFDAPIVRHWGFDLHNLDPDVVRALDGHIFCDRRKLEYLATPRAEGGCGRDEFEEFEDIEFLDSDRPKLEFMNDRFAEPLSEASGELHTVCVGRPFDVDYVAAARRAIHVHVYSNSFDEAYRTIARDLAPGAARKHARLLGRYLHVHTSLQTIGAGWPEIQDAKSRWVEEFSRYDAGWSYIGRPLPWEPLDDRGAIPNRLGTYLLAGLPIVTDRRPGYYRYEEPRRLGVEIELVDSDYDGLRARLEAEVATREKRRAAQAERKGYTFDATIDRLLGALERTRADYLARPYAERIRFRQNGAGTLVHFNTSPGLRTRQPGDPVRREAWRRLLLPWRTRRVARSLRPRDGGPPTRA